MAKVKKDILKSNPEKMVSIYNPFVDAFCEVPVSKAEKLIKSAKEVEQKLKE